MTGPIDPRDLRVSDDERAHVISLLQRATGQGLLDLPEFNERSAAAVAARTRGDLNALLLDLPGLQVAGRTVQQARTATAPPPRQVPGWSGAPAAARGGDRDSVLELLGWGSRTFKGRWTVPARIVIGGLGASTKLDFTEADLSTRTVVVEFRSNSGGSTELVVPHGTSLAVHGLSMRGGHLTNKLTPDDGGVLDLRLTGTKKGGWISVRYPRGGMFGRR
ncbi:DUF1707 domain-containing protein [Nakamurella sp. YIM 132087]|uniref:DUF1707 domain-containing protein n=1 Tax=Nakamurella alba TaxID=2665158 RepID=A0A7K1FNA1_9ACTN|nr:DUF1707 domain-containing protein [Nakamurella alba]MTD15608.1 DUF1707 domain-containing protein [Nakamurella alba]